MMMVLNGMARFVLALAVLMIGGCGVSATETAPQAVVGERIPARTMEDVLTFVYKGVSGNYVDRTTLKPLVIAGLNGLSRLDPKIAVQDQGSSLRLTYDGKPIAQLDPPSNTESPSGWSRVVATGAALAESASPALRGLETDDILSALLNPALSTLDPYTRYLTPTQALEERASRRGFGGVGVTLDTEQIGIIRSVLEDTPAARAGLEAGDRLLTVGDRPVQSLTLTQLFTLLRGDIGSSVTLAVQRGAAPAFTRTLNRAKIYQVTVRAQRDDTGLATVKLSGFNEGTFDAFKAQVKKVADAGPLRGVVLDLRDNPGGTFRTALEIADLFLTEGPIMTVRDRRGIVSESTAASGDELISTKIPLVLLTNGQTASASEVLAAALQDRGRAVVVGSRSFGKGLVQTVYEDLPNKGELIMTTMRLHSPLGYSLHKYGVVPTVCTSRQPDSPSAAAQITADLRTPDFHPEDVLQARRTLDKATEAARETLIGLCPPLTKPRTTDVDMAVAESLLADPSLYARALPVPTIARKP